MCRHFVLLLALMLPVKLVAALATPSFLKITQDVPAEQQALLFQDLGRLQNFSANLVDPEFNRVMDLPEGAVTTQGLLEWLAARVKVLVSDRFRMDSRTLSVVQRGYPFAQPGLVPDSPEMVQEVAADETPRVKTIMSNIGMPIYLDSKKAGELWALKVPGRFSKIRVTSPRVGIIRIGDGLFQIRRTQTEPYSATAADSSYLRLSALFHEGRHSDGNGKSLGMSHQICPEGHDYAGFPACDFSLNGSYSVGAQITKMFAENCKDCSVAEREVLRLEYLDAYSRVLSEKVTLTDADLVKIEALEDVRKACKFLADQQQPLLASCSGIETQLRAAKTAARAKARVQKATFLDSTPEGTL